MIIWLSVLLEAKFLKGKTQAKEEKNLLKSNMNNKIQTLDN